MSARGQRTSADCWQLQDSRAALAGEYLCGTVDLRYPAHGIFELRVAGKPVRGCLLGVDVESAITNDQTTKPWEPLDAYARGRDLVVTYREPRGLPFYLQVYWRMHEPVAPHRAVIDAIVSIQTREWETYPGVTLASALEGEHTIAGADRLVTRRDGWSFVEVAPPGDFELAPPQLNDGIEAPIWRYGNHFMERGVIRRLRLRGAIVPRDGDVAAAEQLQAQLVAEQPPLTA